MLSDAVLNAIHIPCYKCNKPKPVTSFYLSRSVISIKKRYGRQRSCIDCALEYHRSDKSKETGKRYRENQRFMLQDYLSVVERELNLKNKYGISIDNYREMAAKQFGLCAICKIKEATHVDHCHATNRIRQLLCNGCNRGLGLFMEDCIVLANARLYLETYATIYVDPSSCRLGKDKQPRQKKELSTKAYYSMLQRNADLKRRYGVDLAWYTQKLLQQKMACAICCTLNPGGKGMLHVDHCHKTGSIRGLLCVRCNVGIGMFQDDPLVIHKGITYLNRHSLAC